MPSTLEKLDFIDVRANDIMGCTESTRVCLKFTVVFMSIPIAIVGIISLCVGIWVLASDDTFFDLTAKVLDLEVLDQHILQRAAIIMVSTGAAILFLAILGVVGALTMNSCVLVLFVIPLIVVLTLEAAVIVLTVVFKSEWETSVDHFVTGKLKTHYGDSVYGDGFTRSFDALQRKDIAFNTSILLIALMSRQVLLSIVYYCFLNDQLPYQHVKMQRNAAKLVAAVFQTRLHCCGWESSQDYHKLDDGQWNTSLASGEHRQVPDSCCMSGNETWVPVCVVSPHNSTGFSTQGCRQAVTAELKHYQWIIIGVTVSVLVFQFLLVILTLTLVVHNVNHKYNLS